jgi:hypothetical protein
MATNRIHLKGPYRQDEAVTGAASIKPGHLVKKNSAGAVVVHGTEGGKAAPIFAAEDALQGKMVSEAYANAALATLVIPNVGSVVNAMIKDGENIAIGDHLISDGAGRLIEAAEDSALSTSEVVAIAEEACDLTGSNTVDTLCAVMIV